MMKNLDLISKRILVISLSISAVLLSASLLIFSVRPANAQTPSISSRMDDGRRYDAVISGNSLLIWNTQSGTYKTGYISFDNYGSTGGPSITNPNFGKINSNTGNSSEKFW